MNINILYSSDENYVRHAGTSLFSLLENNKKVEKISIYFIDNKISKGSKEKLILIASSFNRVINFIPIETLLVNLNKKDDFPLSGYARLFISKAVDVDKILYIDCDTIVKGSLEELWSIPINDYLVAGVQDNPAIYMAEIVGMNKMDRYINSGVLLMNLKKWRECNLENKFIHFMEKFEGKVPHHDQGVINGVCKDSILILNPKYNMMPQFLMYSAKQVKKLYDIKHYYLQEQLDEATKNPVIIHYISKFFNRPWFEDCNHPMKNLYMDYLNKTDWKNKLYKPNITYKVKIRKWVFNHMPFLIFSIIERILDIKRKMYLKKRYKHLNVLK